MNPPNIVLNFENIIRWTARIWSLWVFIVVLGIVFTPDPQATQPISALEWFMLSLRGIAVFGLLIAWRWELIGGIITIVTMIIREIFWIIIEGDWIVNFLIVWAFLVPPAILFLLAWGLQRRAQLLSDRCAHPSFESQHLKAGYPNICSSLFFFAKQLPPSGLPKSPSPQHPIPTTHSPIIFLDTCAGQ